MLQKFKGLLMQARSWFQARNGLEKAGVVTGIFAAIFLVAVGIILNLNSADFEPFGGIAEVMEVATEVTEEVFPSPTLVATQAIAAFGWTTGTPIEAALAPTETPTAEQVIVVGATMPVSRNLEFNINIGGKAQLTPTVEPVIMPFGWKPSVEPPIGLPTSASNAMLQPTFVPGMSGAAVAAGQLAQPTATLPMTPEATPFQMSCLTMGTCVTPQAPQLPSNSIIAHDLATDAAATPVPIEVAQARAECEVNIMMGANLYGDDLSRRTTDGGTTTASLLKVMAPGTYYQVQISGEVRKYFVLATSVQLSNCDLSQAAKGQFTGSPWWEN